MKRYFRTILIVSCFLLGMFVWSLGVNDPYVGSYNANNNYLTLASRNYIRFGFWNLKTLPTYTTGTTLPQYTDYYLHHPFLSFWIVLVPFIVFGFHNWVVHASMFVFTLGTVGMVYLIGKEVWNKRIGYIAAFLTTFFPMTAFFWKYMMFEQITLFLNLVVVYAYLRYIKTEKRIWLGIIGVFACLSTLSDWYGAYLLFPFIFMLATRMRKQTISVLLRYIPAVAVSLFLFAGVLAATGHIIDTSNAIGTRAVQTELFGLSFWWFRLPVVLFLRFFIYFTPVSIGGILVFIHILRSSGDRLQKAMLAFFCILGILNFVFLPTASWGHSYFVYYCIPFFAYSGAVFLDSIRSGSARYIGYAVIILWSLAVNGSKLAQVRKQAWKFDVSRSIQSFAKPHETIGVINYPGDVLQNYYFINAVPFVGSEREQWIQGTVFRDIGTAVFTCENDCTAGETDFIDRSSRHMGVELYQIGSNKAWILRKDREAASSIPLSDRGIPKETGKRVPSVAETCFRVVLSGYRMLKQVIGEVQL